MKTIVLLIAWMAFSVVRVQGSALASGHNYNTNRPSDGRGWDHEVTINNTTYTIFGPDTSSNTGPKNVIGAEHTAYWITPGIDIVELQGQIYFVVSVTLHPSRDLAIVTIDGNFPVGSGVEFANTNQIVEGVGITMFGNGNPNGEPIYRQDVVTIPSPLLIADLVRDQQTSEFNVYSTEEAEFVVEQTTNLVDWDSIPTTYTTTGQVARVVLTNNDPSMFYRTRSLSTITLTNEILIGWDRMGGGDRARRWGTNQIYWVFDEIFVSYFDRQSDPDSEEACLTPTDSSGGCFLKDTMDGKWKLAGINVLCYHGPFSKDGGATWFYGTMMDIAGLLAGKYNYNTHEIEPDGYYDTGRVQSVQSGYALIDRAWVAEVLQSQQ